MKTVSDRLRDVDPVSREVRPTETELATLRRTILASAANDFSVRVARPSVPVPLLATIAVLAIVALAAGLLTWSQGATLEAAIRFEVRMAEDQPAPGLREAPVAESERVIYLHPEVIVTNEDIAQSRIVPGDGPSRFGVDVELTAAGARRMREATADHIGRPVAVLLDGEVILAPTVRSPIGTSALISGDFTRAEAERIADGIAVR